MPPPAPPEPPERPATLRHIALLADVSQMTVSRALGNRPRVAKETRSRILKLARSLGYRPDPEIVKLMHYLRRGVRPLYQSTICGLTNWPAEPKPAYFQALIAGAEAQAVRRGYGFSVESFAAIPASGPRLQRMLRGRGVQGVMLLPLHPSLDVGPLLDWREF
jgi:DNA-binding LacI/PurR family transcriptional regulator